MISYLDDQTLFFIQVSYNGYISLFILSSTSKDYELFKFSLRLYHSWIFTRHISLGDNPPCLAWYVDECSSLRVLILVCDMTACLPGRCHQTPDSALPSKGLGERTEIWIRQNGCIPSFAFRCWYVCNDPNFRHSPITCIIIWIPLSTKFC